MIIFVPMKRSSPTGLRMKKAVTVLILFSYLLVGFCLPLDSRAFIHHGIEIASKKKPPLQKKFRVTHLWSIVKHVVSKKPTSVPDENPLVPVEAKASYDTRDELLDPPESYAASQNSRLFREVRAPPQV